MNEGKMKVVSFFAGAGGMDLGFEKANFDVIWANDFNKKLSETYQYNHKNTELVVKKIQDLDINEIPDSDVIIGGPPCQAWSLAGAMRGAEDERGGVFYNYVNIIKEKQPKAFVAENVKGIISKTHIKEFNNILSLFEEAGYDVSYKLLNAMDYGVCQSRERVFVVGIRKDLGIKFEFPEPTHKDNPISLEETIGDLRDNPGEYYEGSYSTIFMSRNRRKEWDEVSFTIQAGARHAPIHPDGAEMIQIGKDERIFGEERKELTRRLSVRECARIQSFPDNFEFIAKNIADKYLMIGNAVPVLLAQHIAEQLKRTLNNETE